MDSQKESHIRFMNNRVQILIALLFCMAVINPAIAQKQNLTEPVLGTTDNCEDAKARLDNVRILSGNDGIIILVARLGRGETSRKTNRERLQAVWNYLHHGSAFSEQRIVKTEGDRVSAQGRVDIYGDGRLMLVLVSKRHGDIVGRKSCGMV